MSLKNKVAIVTGGNSGIGQAIVLELARQGANVVIDYVVHPEEARGPDGLKEMVEGYRNALSGLRVTIDQQFTDGDYVTTRYTVTGTHDGDLMGTPPSGKDVAFTGITVSRCESGRIAEEWEITDVVGLLGQIGALPAMAQG